jgi:hypothetical protein
MAAPPRSRAQRRADVLAKLELPSADVWVATSSAEGVAHLVPLSYAWDGYRVILAAVRTSPTIRNLAATGRARLGFGPTRDVVVIDATLERQLDVGAAPVATSDAYAAQAGWDPRLEPEPYAFAFLVPRRIQAWREANELDGRLLMRDGRWLV